PPGSRPGRTGGSPGRRTTCGTRRSPERRGLPERCSSPRRERWRAWAVLLSTGAAHGRAASWSAAREAGGDGVLKVGGLPLRRSAGKVGAPARGPELGGKARVRGDGCLNGGCDGGGVVGVDGGECGHGLLRVEQGGDVGPGGGCGLDNGGLNGCLPCGGLRLGDGGLCPLGQSADVALGRLGRDLRRGGRLRGGGGGRLRRGTLRLGAPVGGLAAQVLDVVLGPLGEAGHVLRLVLRGRGRGRGRGRCGRLGGGRGGGCRRGTRRGRRRRCGRGGGRGPSRGGGRSRGRGRLRGGRGGGCAPIRGGGWSRGRGHVGGSGGSGRGRGRHGASWAGSRGQGRDWRAARCGQRKRPPAPGWGPFRVVLSVRCASRRRRRPRWGSARSTHSRGSTPYGVDPGRGKRLAGRRGARPRLPPAWLVRCPRASPSS